MHYFVTGATGFIGKRLVKKLLERDGAIVYFLMRRESQAKLEGLRQFWGADAEHAVPVLGDLTQPQLGLSAHEVQQLKGGIHHFYHLAAVYDLNADEARQIAANIDGTRQALALAEALHAGHFHHMSSIAAAGLYEGVFREDMFEEAEHAEHPYFRTKHEAEKWVRETCALPWSVYRPGMVVGHSMTGEIDKIDGPYYLFKLIQRLRKWLPPWLPVIGLEGGRINLVPVDFVVDALNAISHQGGIDKKCYHLVDPQGYRVGEVLDIFSQAAHAPKMNLFVNAALFGFIPRSITQGLLALTPVQRVRNALLKDLGVPPDLFTFVNYPTRFDCRETQAALKGTGIACPKLKDYAWRLWDFWERHLDPELHIDRSLRGAVAGKVVLVTGGSSGIGLASAHKFAEAGATTLICGRHSDKLSAACLAAEQCGYRFIAYTVNMADPADCARFVEQVTLAHGAVDFLINNAGRSIRRAIESSFDRFHDFERTMQLNYFGSLRVTLGLLPGMVKQKSGHVVNISSIGVLTNAPRFSAYVASKAALDAWTRCAASEFAEQGVSFTTVSMPLVRTPMIAPTPIYNNVPTLSPAEAADLVVQACIFKPVRIATRLGVFGELLHAALPRIAQIVMNTSFRLFPDTPDAKGLEARGQDTKPPLSAEAMALQQMMRGIHF